MESTEKRRPTRLAPSWSPLTNAPTTAAPRRTSLLEVVSKWVDETDWISSSVDYSNA
jgi:hypothetical protein